MKKLLVCLVATLVLVGLSPVTFAPPNPNADPSDRGALTKIVFIHYKKGFGHKNNHNPGGGNGGTEKPSCYALLAKDAKWKTVENAQVNPTNSGLSSTFLVDNTLASREVWDVETSQELFGDTITVNTSADWDGDTGDLPDGLNEYSFGATDPNVIAVTVIWGYFSAPPPFRELIEYDVLFNTVNTTWGDAGPTNETSLGDTNVMDYLNIAVHETGHGAGLGDIYDAVCTEVTMFGFSTDGETKKRTLATQDINGLHRLYPA